MDCLYSRLTTIKATSWPWASFGNDLKSIVIYCQGRSRTSSGYSYLGV